MLRLEMVEHGALGCLGRLDDVVEAATLKAIGVELAERRLEQLAAGSFGGFDGVSRATHTHTIQTSRYGVKWCT